MRLERNPRARVEQAKQTIGSETAGLRRHHGPADPCSTVARERRHPKVRNVAGMTCPGSLIVHVDGTIAGCTLDEEPRRLSRPRGTSRRLAAALHRMVGPLRLLRHPIGDRVGVA